MNLRHFSLVCEKQSEVLLCYKRFSELYLIED